MVEFRFARFAPGLIPCRDHGPLAQLAERRADNAEVGGSSPPRPTTEQIGGAVLLFRLQVGKVGKVQGQWTTATGRCREAGLRAGSCVEGRH